MREMMSGHGRAGRRLGKSSWLSWRYDAPGEESLFDEDSSVAVKRNQVARPRKLYVRQREELGPATIMHWMRADA